MIHRLILLGCAMILTWTGTMTAAFAQQEQSVNRRATVLFVNGMSFREWEELRSYPHVGDWLKQGGIGALTIRSAGPRHEAAAYLQMGSGGQAVYTIESGTAYGARERMDDHFSAREWLERWSGESGGIPDHAVVFPGIYRLKRENEGQPFTARLGLLGNLLAKNGISVAVYGNSDRVMEKSRYAALFAMDESGIVPRGDVSDRLLAREERKGRILGTDYRYLLERWRQEPPNGLTVLELGDLARLYDERKQMEEGHFQKLRKQVLGEMARFLDTVLREKGQDHLVMLVSPQVNPEAMEKKELLLPIAVWKPGQRGLLSSRTTRQPGVVSGIDIAPTLLEWFRVPVPNVLDGHVLTAENVFRDDVKVEREAVFAWGTEDDQPSNEFIRWVSGIQHIYQNRPPVITGYVCLQMIVLALATGLWLWSRRNGPGRFTGLIRTVRLSLLAMLFFPALFLLEPLLHWTVPWFAVVGAMIGTALLGASLVKRLPFPQTLMAVAGITVMCVLLDGFTGAKAMQRSYLGYDPIIGARFYGMGNEYEGVVIGSAVLLAASLYEQRKNRQPGNPGRLSLVATFCLFGLVLYYMAAPHLGANAGGFLAGAVAFSFALSRLEGWEWGRRGWWLTGFLLLMGMAVLITLNLLSSHPPTHVGKVAHQLLTGDWREVGNILERKLEMNLRLIRVSMWSKVFALSLVAIGLLSLRPERYLRRMAARYPFMVKGFGGIVAGSLATLALNDSGIVSAATSIVFFVVPALYAALGENYASESSAHSSSS